MTGCEHRWLDAGAFGSMTCQVCGREVHPRRRFQPFEGRDAERINAALGGRHIRQPRQEARTGTTTPQTSPGESHRYPARAPQGASDGAEDGDAATGETSVDGEEAR